MILVCQLGGAERSILGVVYSLELGFVEASLFELLTPEFVSIYVLDIVIIIVEVVARAVADTVGDFCVVEKRLW